MLVLDGSVTKKPNKQKGLEKKRNPESELSGRRRNRQKAKRVRKNALSLQNSRVSTLVEATGLARSGSDGAASVYASVTKFALNYCTAETDGPQGEVRIFLPKEKSEQAKRRRPDNGGQ